MKYSDMLCLVLQAKENTTILVFEPILSVDIMLILQPEVSIYDNLETWALKSITIY